MLSIDWVGGRISIIDIDHNSLCCSQAKLFSSRKWIAILQPLRDSPHVPAFHSESGRKKMGDRRKPELLEKEQVLT